MKKTLLVNRLFSTAAAAVLLTGIAFGQEPTVTTKRNSPFSPNPKMKTATTSDAPQNVESKANTDDGKVVSVEASIRKPNGSGKADVQFQAANFESRSSASKTLEVAKKASIASAAPTDVYKVGVGDVLFISLQNAPAKDSTYFTVLKDGTIDYPLANEMVSVAGLTTDEIETNLKAKIKLYQSPQVSVNVREHNSHSYTVLGLVEKAGEKFLQREAVPLFVVRAEAIVQPKVNKAIIKHADSTTETIDVKDSRYDEALIFPGDIVEFKADTEATVTTIANQPQFYYIGGAIKSGGQKDFYRGLTLTQAILACGGLRKSGAQDVVIRRKNVEGLLAVASYNLKDIKDGKSPDPQLEAGDTIEVGN